MMAFEEVSDAAGWFVLLEAVSILGAHQCYEAKNCIASEGHATEGDADKAALARLARFAARATFPDLAPLQHCAKCGTPIRVREAHTGLSVARQLENVADGAVVNVGLVALFCGTCLPTDDASWERMLDATDPPDMKAAR